MLAIVVSCDIKWREEIWLSQPGKRKRKHCHNSNQNVQNLESWSIITRGVLLQLFYQLKHTYNSLPLPTPMHLNSQHQILKAKSRIQKQSQKEKSLAKIKASTLRAAAIATM
jgi:hypothetical protein